LPPRAHAAESRLVWSCLGDLDSLRSECCFCSTLAGADEKAAAVQEKAADVAEKAAAAGKATAAEKAVAAQPSSGDVWTT